MIKNYISENISYLLKNSNLSQDDFGQLFDVGKGLISNYINKRALPKIETIQKMCNLYKITIDDFVNTDLSDKKYKVNNSKMMLNEPQEGYGVYSTKYVSLLEKTIEDKETIINTLKEKYENNSTASKQA